MPKSIYRDEYRVLIELIRAARERAGVTQGAVAAAFGRPQSTLSHVEAGSRRLDVVEFVDYCRVVGADPRAVFDEFLRRIEKSGKRPRRKS